LYAVLDASLLPVVAFIFARLLLRAKNYRNLPLALILSLLAAANVTFHLSVLGLLSLPTMTPLHAALGLIIMIESVVAGRVIPAFTMAATPGLRLQALPWLERSAIGMTAVGLLLWLFAPAGVLGAGALMAAAGLQGARLLGWKPLLARQKPILWILHAAYAWIATGLFLLALSQLGWVAVSVGVHALAVGATGGLIMGMVTRTARGHTGRPLSVATPEVAAYALVMAAAVLRVLVPLFVPGAYLAALVLAAAAWGLAFAIYLWVYTPWLLQPRLDGKNG
jgi:uncharacterized protein involved in response to NO